MPRFCIEASLRLVRKRLQDGSYRLPRRLSEIHGAIVTPFSRYGVGGTM